MEVVNVEVNQKSLVIEAELSIETLDMEELSEVVGGFTGAEKAIITL